MTLSATSNGSAARWSVQPEDNRLYAMRECVRLHEVQAHPVGTSSERYDLGCAYDGRWVYDVPADQVPARCLHGTAP